MSSYYLAEEKLLFSIEKPHYACLDVFKPFSPSQDVDEDAETDAERREDVAVRVNGRDKHALYQQHRKYRLEENALKSSHMSITLRKAQLFITNSRRVVRTILLVLRNCETLCQHSIIAQSEQKRSNASTHSALLVLHNCETLCQHSITARSEQKHSNASTHLALLVLRNDAMLAERFAIAQN